MESLRELYRIGPGPSSSHTLAVKRICECFLSRYPHEPEYVVRLYGSLSLTGRGHMTDKVIAAAFAGRQVRLEFCNEWRERPNTLTITAGKAEMTFYSVGGGAYEIKGEPRPADQNVYPEKSMKEILELCNKQKIRLTEYLCAREPDIKPYLDQILEQMFRTIESGLGKTGLLPGDLKLSRISGMINRQAEEETDPAVRKTLLITAYAYASSEENASGGTVVTAPTLGSCGVLPSVLYYYHKQLNASGERLRDALAIAGLFGNLIKDNATISGAEGGCQAEIGAACAMAAAAVGFLENESDLQISNSAEIGIEHNLGLTCDPVEGYVMIPCIERNGVAALRAVDAAIYSKYLGRIKPNRVSFDMVVKTMNYTGKKIARELRETSLGGLAEVVK